MNKSAIIVLCTYHTSNESSRRLQFREITINKRALVIFPIWTIAISYMRVSYIKISHCFCDIEGACNTTSINKRIGEISIKSH